MSTKRGVKGFSLIELMIVIAIIGILASIAVPSYRSYIRKAQMLEVITMLKSFTDEIVAGYMESGGTFPNRLRGFLVANTGNNAFNATQNGGSDKTVNIIYAITANFASIAIQVSSELGGGIPQMAVWPRPGSNSAPVINCGFNGVGQGGSSLPYMPASCLRTDILITP